MLNLSQYLKPYKNSYNNALTILDDLSKYQLTIKDEVVTIKDWNKVLTKYGGDCVDLAEDLYFKLKTEHHLKSKVFFCRRHRT